MTVYKEQISVQSHGNTPTYTDITPMVKEAIKNSKIRNGTCTVISPHTTCSVFFEEFVHDYNEAGLNKVLEKIVPDQINAEMYTYPGKKHYEEVESWPNVADYLPDGDRSALWNCDAHLKSTLLGSSEVFAVDDGKLGVGTTGYVYFADFDRTRPRTRKCKIIIMGE
ncbi:MAG: YjbQ family protein [Eubacterium sp.]